MRCGQVAEKFVQLGVLKLSGCRLRLRASRRCAPFRGLKSNDETEALVAEANVVVATMAVLATMPAELQAHFASQFTHLFVDEAHHIGAATWREFKLLFTAK